MVCHIQRNVQWILTSVNVQSVEYEWYIQQAICCNNKIHSSSTQVTYFLLNLKDYILSVSDLIDTFGSLHSVFLDELTRYCYIFKIILRLVYS